MGKVCILTSLNVDYTVSMDRIPTIGETIIGSGFSKNFGGKGANQAVCVKRLGTDVNIIGKIGEDKNGEDYIKALTKENISLEHLYVDKNKPTGVAFINVNKIGENNIVIIPGANKTLDCDDIHKSKSVIHQADIILSQFEVPFESTMEAFKIARKKDVFTVLNPAPYEFIPDEFFPFIDLLIPNESEMEHLTGANMNDVTSMVTAARNLINKGVKFVVITLGDKGSLVVSERRFEVIQARNVSVTDTTAAGDSFIGGMVHFLSNVNNNINFEKILESCQYATLVASLTVQKNGAQPSLPTLEEVGKLLKQ